MWWIIDTILKIYAWNCNRRRQPKWIGLVHYGALAVQFSPGYRWSCWCSSSIPSRMCYCSEQNNMSKKSTFTLVPSFVPRAIFKSHPIQNMSRLDKNILNYFSHIDLDVGPLSSFTSDSELNAINKMPITKFKKKVHEFHCHNRILCNYPNLRANSKVKYLGIIIDQFLKWDKHIKF